MKQTFKIWTLDSKGNKQGDPMTVRSWSASTALQSYRKRTGKKAAQTRLQKDICMMIDKGNA